MAERDESKIDLDVVSGAFEVMGRYLREREALGEIAIYGGTAILLQFDWRRTTQDVDAVILNGEREGAVKDAVAYAALALGLPDEWLNNYVDGFTPEREERSFFSAFGSYPAGETPGLRVFLAKPEYLCAMKLKALERGVLDDRDFNDAVRLAREVGVEDEEGLMRIYAGFFPDEELPPLSALRLPEVAVALRAGKAA